MSRWWLLTVPAGAAALAAGLGLREAHAAAAAVPHLVTGGLVLAVMGLSCAVAARLGPAMPDAWTLGLIGPLGWGLAWWHGRPGRAPGAGGARGSSAARTPAPARHPQPIPWDRVFQGPVAAVVLLVLTYVVTLPFLVLLVGGAFRLAQ